MLRTAIGVLVSLRDGLMLWMNARAWSKLSAKSSFFLDLSKSSTNSWSWSVVFKYSFTVSTDSFLRSL
ncbi:hypothetical protein MT325_m118R [Paramecium bursaria chlorella virus MT325]|uniref:Uncharacterized protein m118R n=1 Tax=Paramecium bursaria Chlorella virus MT325 TaxID=346932 RepID=A7ITJ8_PBCVM|nr:hypothetical protein MT325_m118R [Paramecium bursaria chlorella virus MT325]